MSEKPETKKKTISVNHEWGTLKDVIIGSQPIGNNMTFPKMKSGKKPTYMTDRTLELSERFPGESYYTILIFKCRIKFISFSFIFLQKNKNITILSLYFFDSSE